MVDDVRVLTLQVGVGRHLVLDVLIVIQGIHKTFDYVKDGDKGACSAKPSAAMHHNGRNFVVGLSQYVSMLLHLTEQIVNILILTLILRGRIVFPSKVLNVLDNMTLFLVRPHVVGLSPVERHHL